MNSMKKNAQALVKVQYFYADSNDEGQRLDNYLIKKLKGVPKAHIYRIIRKGEVRVNKKRKEACYKLFENDQIRIPPMQLKAEVNQVPPSITTIDRLKARIQYEDDNLMILNKPAGMSVHVGSSVRIGIIEALRYAFPKLKHLELAHRLDSETSGCLVLAKRRSILKELHEMFKNGEVKKIYWTLTQGKWKKSELMVDLPLHKFFQKGQVHEVRVSQQGKKALTEFYPLTVYDEASLMGVQLHTGRTHQIRVHASHLGHPIAGDLQYGDDFFNKQLNMLGLKRMFLHAKKIEFTLRSINQHISIETPLDEELTNILTMLSKTK